MALRRTHPQTTKQTLTPEMSAINANYKRNTIVDGVSRCCVCKQTRPCCRQTLFELNEHGTHDNLVRPIKGPLKEAWGLGSVYVTCCGSVYVTCCGGVMACITIRKQTNMISCFWETVQSRPCPVSTM